MFQLNKVGPGVARVLKVIICVSSFYFFFVSLGLASLKSLDMVAANPKDYTDFLKGDLINFEP